MRGCTEYYCNIPSVVQLCSDLFFFLHHFITPTAQGYHFISFMKIFGVGKSKAEHFPQTHEESHYYS